MKEIIIVDNGSGHMKAGIQGDPAPSVVFASMVGRPKHSMIMGGGDEQEYFLGPCLSKRGVLSMSYPITNGIITDWEDMERVWRYTFFDELRLDPEEHPVLMTEAPMNPKKNREKMMEMLFEKFCVPACFFVIQAVMSLYSTGRTSGVVMDSGDGVTHTVPIYEGFGMPHAIVRLNLAGRDLSEYLGTLLHSRGLNMTSSSETEIVRDMKEKMCYVAESYDDELLKIEDASAEIEKEYVLPDGNVVHLSHERFQVPEAFFKPSLLGKELIGIHDALDKTVRDCDVDMRRELWKSIVLSGGSTLYPGLPERLHTEMVALVPNGIKVHIIAEPQRRYTVWIGASILSQLSMFEGMLIMKHEYEECGSAIVHRKCVL